ncbi:MAG: hypothetical protein Q9219_002361 [cf. Caloplaca sp. 3 TL-2023]
MLFRRLQLLVFLVEYAPIIPCKASNPTDIPATLRPELIQPPDTFTTIKGIPREFTIKKLSDRSPNFQPEACYINMLVALHDVARGDWTSKMAIASYRTTTFMEPLIEVHSPRQVDLFRAYIAWGLFLTTFYMNANNLYKLSSFSMMWEDKVIGGISIGGPAPTSGILPLTVDQTPTTTAPAAVSERFLRVTSAFFGTHVFSKGNVYTTLATALLQAAPAPDTTRLKTTWISFLVDLDCAVVAIPAPAARGSEKSYFEVRDLLDVLVKSAEYFAMQDTYRQLSMNISVDRIMVAQVAIWHKGGAEFRSFMDGRNNESLAVA